MGRWLWRWLLWHIAGDESRDHDRHEENSGHTFERSHHPHIRIERRNPSVADASQGDHAEIKQRSALRERKCLIERMVHETIQDPILAFSCSILWAIFDHFRTRSRDLRSAIAEAFISYLVIKTAYSQV